MHPSLNHVLHTPAILRQIFSYDQVDSGTLARSARVCKAFSDPALDELWWFLDNFMHLLNLLNVLQTNVLDERGRKYVLQEAPSNEQWERLHTYARRVRRILMPMAHLDIHPSVFSALIEHSFKQPLFPTLLDLLWPYDHLPDFELVELVICIVTHSAKTLRWVRAVDCGPCDDGGAGPEDLREPYQLELLLRTLASEALSLQTLELGTRFSIYLVPCLAPCMQLKKFQTTFTTVSDLLRICAPMASLTELDAQLMENGGADIPLCTGFSALAKLSLSYGCIAEVVHLMRAISSPDVQSIKMQNLVTDSWEDVHACLDMLDSRIIGSLRTFHLNCDLRIAEKQTTRFAVIAQSLFRFDQLKDISIRLGALEGIESKIRLTDREIVDVASVWPNLSTFLLAYPPATVVSVYTALAAFARHCPCLTEINLGIGLDESPSELVPRTRVASACGPHALARLKLPWGELDVTDDVVFARFLFGAFPELDIPWMILNSTNISSGLLAALKSRQAARRRKRQPDGSPLAPGTKIHARLHAKRKGVL